MCLLHWCGLHLETEEPLKIIDVETTVQTTVSAKAPVEDGFQTVLQRLEKPLAADVRRLQRPVPDPADKAFDELRKRARPLAGKVVLLTVAETHVGRPLNAPAAQMAIMHRLTSLGLSAVVPQEPVAGWKESLLQTGRYGDKKVDYLLEGEGTSAFAAQLHGMVSCRARVELRVAPEFRHWPNVWPYGWECRPRTYSPKPTSMVMADGKRYVMAYNGLHDVSDAGEVRRSWSFHAGRRDHDNLARDSIITPSSFPDDNPRTCYQFVAQGGSHLFLVGGRVPTAEVLCYEPATDTWFGPLRLEGIGDAPYPLGTAQGVWVGGPDGLAYIATADFLEAARAAGRVMTTAAVAERKRELAEAAGLLEAAKFRLLLRDFDGARQRAETILAANPNDPQALLLMAVLHDFWCFDEPDESLRWYRRLSALEADPSAIYTGLYGEFRINYTLKRWDAAIAAGDRLLEDIPHLYGGMTPTIELFLGYARKQRDQTGG